MTKFATRRELSLKAKHRHVLQLHINDRYKNYNFPYPHRISSSMNPIKKKQYT